MLHPRYISIHDYTYELPDDRIAAYPLPERDQSRLLIYKKGHLSESVYARISDAIPAHSLLVFNNTRVVEARLLFQKPSGGIIEIFCLEPHEQYPDITSAMAQTGTVLWKCFVGGASKWKRGQTLHKTISSRQGDGILEARFVEKRTDHFVIGLSWKPASLSFAEVLPLAGAIPLPPYIRRRAESNDQDRYQTVYAQHKGSVAAPTAGLHFTPAIFDAFAQKKIDTAFVTLHVGAGTFQPVKADQMADHAMHTEWIDVSRSLIERLLHPIEHPVIAVGTTSLRTLESLYWIGHQLANNKTVHPPNQHFEVTQWEPYDTNAHPLTKQEALRQIINWMDREQQNRLLARTAILIAPGYSFQMIDGLVTNFHQPQSTLLLLVAALVGNRWKEIYNYALEHEFRFLSYGDGSLLWKD